jgi:lipopolysaccharide transport system permease protein
VNEAPPLDLGGLVWTLVRTDFKVRYHRTLMGFLWALLKPAALLLAMLAIFSFVFHNERDYALKLVLAVFLWEFFSEGTKVGLISLHQKGYLLTKTSFPRWVVVVCSLSNPLITLATVCSALGLVMAATGRAPSLLGVALFAFYALCLVVIVLGVSLATSVLFLSFRDLNQVWEVFTSAGFFLAPIVYPLSVLPERMHFWLYAVPATPIIQFSREVLVDGTVPTLKAHLLLVGMTATIFATGVFIFRAKSPRAMEAL